MFFYALPGNGVYFLRGGTMYSVWINKVGRKFLVMTGKVTPFGFERVRKMNTTEFQVKLRSLAQQIGRELVGGCR